MSAVGDFLGGVPVFAGMSALEREAVASFLSPRELASGAVLFREGDPGSELFVVRSGRLGSWVAQADGGRREIYEFPPGALFGEMAIVEGAPRSATCYAKEASSLLVLDALDFYRLVWEHPVIGVKLLSAMARYMTSWLDEASGFLGGLARWGEAARRRAITDELSGLFNRRFLVEAVEGLFARGSLASRRSSLVMLDVDRFRDINAAFGPQAGDAIIATAGAAFGSLAAEGEIAARLSGDEFALFLPGSGPERALELGEAIRATAESLFLEFKRAPGREGERVAITVSVGVASAPECAADPSSLFAAADRALYAAKEAGRNRVVAAAPAPDPEDAP